MMVSNFSTYDGIFSMNLMMVSNFRTESYGNKQLQYESYDGKQLQY